MPTITKVKIEMENEQTESQSTPFALPLTTFCNSDFCDILDANGICVADFIKPTHVDYLVEACNSYYASQQREKQLRTMLTEAALGLTSAAIVADECGRKVEASIYRKHDAEILVFLDTKEEGGV